MILVICTWMLIVFNAFNALVSFALMFNDEECLKIGVGKLISTILYNAFVIVTVLGLMN